METGITRLSALLLSSQVPGWPRLSEQHREGIIGARFGNMVISSPNAVKMVLPLYGHDRDLLLRNDFRFGIDDPIVHPQPYFSSTSNIPCMLAPSSDPATNYLFRPFQDSWWEPVPGLVGLGKFNPSVLRDFQKRSNAWVAHVEKIKTQVAAGVYPHVSGTDFDTKKLRDSLYSLKQGWWMCGQPGTLADIKFRYVNAQRWEINLRSRIDEQLIYRPHLGSISHAHRPVDTSRMGALTTSFTQALILYNAGLPVWYVYEASVASPSRFKRFLSDQEVDQMSGCIEIPPDGLQMGEYSGNVPSLTWLTGGQPFITRTVAPKAVSLFHGPAGHPNRYEAMTNVLSGFRCPWEAPQQPAANFSTSPAREVEHEFTFEFPLPSAGDDDFPGPPVSDSASLDASSSTSVAPSTSAPVASSTASVASGSAPPPTSPLKPGVKRAADASTSAPSKSKKASVVQPDRSRFDDVVLPWMPRGIPSVLAALARVRKTSKLTGREKPTYKGVKPEHAYYVLPEAAMIALLKDEMTRAVYIVNICRLQPLLEYRVEAVHHPGKNTPGLQAQKWRDVLGMSMNHKSTTRSEKRRTELMELFEKSSVASGLPPGTTDLRKLNLMTAQWCNETIAIPDRPLTLPRVDICREVLWVMSEASWRFELVCLDYWLFKHPRNVPHAPSKRRGEVLQSIPHFGFSMWPDGIEDRGFASEDLDERFEAVYGLTRVMQGWTRACKLPVATTEKAYDMLMNREKRKVLEQEPYLIENEVKELEGIVIEHYITSFIHVFQRVPSLPRAVSSPQMPVAA